jgi:hypothetical protein
VLIPISLNIGFGSIPSRNVDTSRHLCSLSRLGQYPNAGEEMNIRCTSICPVADGKVNFVGTLRLCSTDTIWQQDVLDPCPPLELVRKADQSCCLPCNLCILYSNAS